MPRKKKSDLSTAPSEPLHAAYEGSNENVELKHFAKLAGIEAKLASVRQELKTAWDEAEADGIEKKPFKAAIKLAKGNPATADQFIKKFTHYTTQLGLFDRIDQWKQAEQHEANKGSVARAEADAESFEEPKSGGKLEAAYAQGFEAGQAGKITAADNAYNAHSTDMAEAWERGFLAGARESVDATNSAQALAEA